MKEPAKKRNRCTNSIITQRPTGTGKRLTLSERLLIRAQKGIESVRATARLYGVTTSTVQKVWQDVRLDERAKEIALIKETMADDLYLVAAAALRRIMETIGEARAKDAGIVTGIMIDKAMLLDEKTTQNVTIQGILGIINSINTEKI